MAKNSSTKYQYTRLANIKPGEIQNVWGVVKFCKQPVKSKGTDYMQLLSLTDETLDDNDKIVVTLFCKSMKDFPSVNIGDVIRLHRLKIELFRDEKRGKNGPGFSWLVVSDDVDKPVTLTSNFTYTDQCKQRVRELHALSKRMIQQDRTRLDSVVGGQYFDLLCQVIGVHQDEAKADTVILRVWDGTLCKLPLSPAAEVISDVDPVLEEVAAHLAVDLNVFDNHVASCQNIKPGDYIKLMNLHAQITADNNAKANFDDSTSILLCLHHGTAYGRGILHLTPDNRQVVELKLDLEKHRQGACASQTQDNDDVAGPSNVAVPGTFNVAAGPSGVAVTRTSSVAVAGPSSVAIPGSSGVAVLRPSNFALAGPSGVAVTGTSSVALAGLSGVAVPGSSSASGPSDIRLASSNRNTDREKGGTSERQMTTCPLTNTAQAGSRKSNDEHQPSTSKQKDFVERATSYRQSVSETHRRSCASSDRQSVSETHRRSCASSDRQFVSETHRRSCASSDRQFVSRTRCRSSASSSTSKQAGVNAEQEVCHAEIHLVSDSDSDSGVSHQTSLGVANAGELSNLGDGGPPLLVGGKRVPRVSLVRLDETTVKAGMVSLNANTPSLVASAQKGVSSQQAERGRNSSKCSPAMGSRDVSSRDVGSRDVSSRDMGSRDVSSRDASSAEQGDYSASMSSDNSPDEQCSSLKRSRKTRRKMTSRTFQSSEPSILPDVNTLQEKLVSLHLQEEETNLNVAKQTAAVLTKQSANVTKQVAVSNLKRGVRASRGGEVVRAKQARMFNEEEGEAVSIPSSIPICMLQTASVVSGHEHIAHTTFQQIRNHSVPGKFRVLAHLVIFHPNTTQPPAFVYQFCPNCSFFKSPAVSTKTSGLAQPVGSQMLDAGKSAATVQPRRSRRRPRPGIWHVIHNLKWGGSDVQGLTEEETENKSSSDGQTTDVECCPSCSKEGEEWKLEMIYMLRLTLRDRQGDLLVVNLWRDHAVKFFGGLEPRAALEDSQLQQLATRLHQVSLSHLAAQKFAHSITESDLRSKLPPMLDCCLFSYKAPNGGIQYHVFDTVLV